MTAFLYIDDRFRGVHGTRSVTTTYTYDIVRLGLAGGDWVDVTTAVEPEVERRVGPLQILAYDIPQGCCAAYYPECNPLVPLWHHAERSKVPAAKSIPVRLRLRLSSAVAFGDARPQRTMLIAAQR